MDRHRDSARMSILAVMCFAFLLLNAQESFGGFSRISIGGSAGAGVMPLKDITDFLGQLQLGYFTKDRLGSYLNLDMAYRITEEHTIVLNVEKIEISASLFDVMLYTTDTGDTIGHASLVAEYAFKAMPVGISYEYCPAILHDKVFPLLGVGLSYFVSQGRYEAFELYNPQNGLLSHEASRDGKGYGFHAYIGLHSQVTEHLYLVSRLRGRYADGMGFTDSPEDIKIEFTGIDFTTGFGWRF